MLEALTYAFGFACKSGSLDPSHLADSNNNHGLYDEICGVFNKPYVNELMLQYHNKKVKGGGRKRSKRRRKSKGRSKRRRSKRKGSKKKKSKRRKRKY